MLDDDWLVSHEYQISLARYQPSELALFFGLLLSSVGYSFDKCTVFNRCGGHGVSLSEISLCEGVAVRRESGLRVTDTMCGWFMTRLVNADM
jgi:hypothetical protein